MRKLIKLAVIAFGIRALVHWWRKRHESQQAASPAPTPATDQADELRRKLAESRDDATDDAEVPPATAVSDRRADVHEQGRAALDEMKSSDEV